MNHAKPPWGGINIGDIAVFVICAAIALASFAATGAEEYFFPRLIAALLLVLSLLRLITAWRRHDAEKHSGTALRRALPGLLVIAAYLAVADWLGFYFSAAAVFFALSVMYAPNPRKSLIKSALLTLAVIAVLYATFSWGIGVQVPDGFLI